MDYQERLQRAENRAKKVAIITVAVLILATFIIICSDGELYILVALFGGGIAVNSLLVANVFDIKEEYKREEQRKIQEMQTGRKEKKEMERERIESKKQLLIKTWNEKMNALCCSEEDSVRVRNKNWLWVANGNLYEAEDVDRFVKRC